MGAAVAVVIVVGVSVIASVGPWSREHDAPTDLRPYLLTPGDFPDGYALTPRQMSASAGDDGTGVSPSSCARAQAGQHRRDQHAHRATVVASDMRGAAPAYSETVYSGGETLDQRLDAIGDCGSYTIAAANGTATITQHLDPTLRCPGVDATFAHVAAATPGSGNETGEVDDGLVAFVEHKQVTAALTQSGTRSPGLDFCRVLAKVDGKLSR